MYHSIKRRQVSFLSELFSNCHLEHPGENKTYNIFRWKKGDLGREKKILFPVTGPEK